MTTKTKMNSVDAEILKNTIEVKASRVKAIISNLDNENLIDRNIIKEGNDLLALVDDARKNGTSDVEAKALLEDLELFIETTKENN